MTEKKPFLVIAHPKRTDGIPHWLHAATLESMAKPCQFCHIYENHIFDIGKSRQRLTEIFLRMPEATHLLFVDDDIIIPLKDSLVNMWNFLEKNNEYIVSGLFYRKSPPHYPLLIACEEIDGKIRFGFPCGMNPPVNKVCRVGATGGGLLLIKREVFEKVESPWWVWGDPEMTKKQAIFEEDSPYNEWTGEDIYFSLKARAAGFSIWVDTRADLLHYVPQFIGNQKLVKLVMPEMTTCDAQIQRIRAERQQMGGGNKT